MEVDEDEGESGAKVVVGLDFGTSFSGFAFCHKSDPDRINTFYDWPDQVKGGSKPYCKTQTSLHYVLARGTGPHRSDEDYVLRNWGWSAQVGYLEALQAWCKRDQKQRVEDLQEEVGYLVKRFKVRLASRLSESPLPAGSPDLLLAPGPGRGRQSKLLSSALNFTKRIFSSQDHGTPDTAWDSIKAEVECERKKHDALALSVLDGLPSGMSVERAISDYLAKMTDFIMAHLQHTYGKHLTKRQVQWCLTVPAIWDDRAKQHMRSCAEKAGMVTGMFCPEQAANLASPHPLQIVLESEAASVYCLTKSKLLGLGKGSHFLVADVGGGTVDIVVHTMSSSTHGTKALSMQEAKQSTGGLCGGSYVDHNFLSFLSHRIGGFDSFVRANPTFTPILHRRWEEIKCSFDGSFSWDQSLDFELPRKLATAWKRHDVENGKFLASNNYDELAISASQMKDIFDPVIDQILDLIRAQMSAEIKVLMIVGGFSASPYLNRRLRGAFGMQVEEIICPPDPGSAICQGAVALGASPCSIVTSRIARRTYGIATFRDPCSMDPPGSQVLRNGKLRCRDGFHIFVRKGDRIGIDQCVKHRYCPAVDDQQGIRFELFSSPSPAPVYVTERGVQLEGSFLFDISGDASNLGRLRSVCISMFFGRSCIEVRAQRQNFGDVNEVVKLEPLGGLADPFAFKNGELQMLVPMSP